MTITTNVQDMFTRHAGEALKCGDLGIPIPRGHIGPVLLSDTGRAVWWTGRVAIGLRYQAPRHSEAPGQSALWVQDLLLHHA